jgi:hypothetical protein
MDERLVLRVMFDMHGGLLSIDIPYDFGLIVYIFAVATALTLHDPML